MIISDRSLHKATCGSHNFISPRVVAEKTYSRVRSTPGLHSRTKRWSAGTAGNEIACVQSKSGAPIKRQLPYDCRKAASNVISPDRRRGRLAGCCCCCCCWPMEAQRSDWQRRGEATHHHGDLSHGKGVVSVTWLITCCDVVPCLARRARWCRLRECVKKLYTRE